MARARLIAAAVLLVAGAAACGEDQDPRPPEWCYIARAIIRPSCATGSCHSNQSRAGGIVLEDPHGGYVMLAGYPGSGSIFIRPNDPDSSRLVKLLRGDETYRMPLDWPLPEADIQLIEQWIRAGAQEGQCSD